MGYKQAELRISTICVSGKTRPEQVFYSAPFKLMNFFETPSGGIEYMVMNASAGIMANDRYEISIEVGKGGQLTLLPQSYEKIHKMDDGEAIRNTKIVVEKNAFFKYISLPMIPFAGSAFRAATTIILADESSQLLYGEILASGRHLRNEKFAYQHYGSCIDIFLKEKLVSRDYSVFTPGTMAMEGYGLFENYTYLANLFIYGFLLSEEKIEKIIQYCEDLKSEVGITPLLGGGYLVRLLDDRAEELIGIFSSIAKMF